MWTKWDNPRELRNPLFGPLTAANRTSSYAFARAHVPQPLEQGPSGGVRGRAAAIKARGGAPAPGAAAGRSRSIGSAMVGR